MLLRYLLRYLRTLPTIRVHPELDERKLDIVHSLIKISLITSRCLGKGARTILDYEQSLFFLSPSNKTSENAHARD